MIWGALFSLFVVHNSFAIVGTEEIAQALIQTTKAGNVNYTGFVPNSKVTDLQVVMRVHLRDLENIEKFGFMNQFQSKKSSGSFDHDFRTSTESAMVELSEIPMEPKALRPKYGTIHMDLVGETPNSYSTTSYGEVVFVFGRHILPRTTWSASDSLGSPHNVYPVSATQHLQAAFSSYPEAQIWGDLDLSDVEMIVIDENARKFKGDIIQFAKRNRIDVYTTRGEVGETNAVLRSPKISLLHEFSSKTISKKSRILLTERALRKEAKSSDMSAPLAHWASFLAPDLLEDSEFSYRDDYIDVEKYTIAGLKDIYKRAGSRYPLKAAIVRYFRREAWIPKADKDRLEKTLSADKGFSEIQKWIKIWARRSKGISKGDPEYETAIKKIVAVGKEEPKETTDDPEEIFQEIKKLSKEVRHGDSEESRRLALGALNKILTKKATQEVIAERFVRNERFAQIVYRHSDALNKNFLKIYFRYLKDYDEREPAQDRALKKCAELLGESA